MAKHKVADIISVDGPVERLPSTVAKMPLEKVQAIVGGYIEHVRVGGAGELWCNEEGALQGLPSNNTASRMTGHAVVGDVIVESWE